jgi:hypothetical protein
MHAKLNSFLGANILSVIDLDLEIFVQIGSGSVIIGIGI